MDIYFLEFFGRGGGHLNMAVAKTGLFLQRGMVFILVDVGKVYINIYWNIYWKEEVISTCQMPKQNRFLSTT